MDKAYNLKKQWFVTGILGVINKSFYPPNKKK